MKKTIKTFAAQSKVQVIPTSKLVNLKGGGKVKRHKPKGD